MRKNRNIRKKRFVFTAVAALAAMFCALAVAQPAPTENDPPQAKMPFYASRNDIARFCKNIDSKAQDARFALQMHQLELLRNEIDGRLKILEEKRKGYEDWLARRNAFLARTQDSFVSIISKMRPAAAAAQLARVDEMTAASIILKLEPRISSAIMNEMPPEKSANLMRILVSAQKLPAEKAANNSGSAQRPARTAP